MIDVTMDAEPFFEKNAIPLYIYGAGNVGKWVAEFMKRCGMDFEAFIDKRAKENWFVGDKKVMHPSEMKRFGNEQMRIVIAVGQPETILQDFLFYGSDCNLYVLLPVYRNRVTGERFCNVNRMLAYFRRKLLKTDIPTFISNDCCAAVLYEALGEIAMPSPTISTYIRTESFLKLCADPESYFSEDIHLDHWEMCCGLRVPVGVVRDIEVFFMYDGARPEHAINAWNKRRTWVKYDKLFFIASNEHELRSFTQIQAQKFCSMQGGKHLLVSMEGTPVYGTTGMSGMLCTSHRAFFRHDIVIENYFDLLGWIHDGQEWEG